MKTCPFCKVALGEDVLTCTACGGYVGKPALRHFSEDASSVGAECPNCGAVLKISKERLKEKDGGYVSINKLICPCKCEYDEIAFANIGKRPQANFKDKTSTSQSEVRCPKCGSTQITGYKKGFGVGKAVGGGILLGPAGLLGGFLGSQKVVVACLKCGHRWKP